MLTLPLDLILYISDIGNLSIKDIFHLSQANKLFREKLLHPYFWHMVYNQKLAKSMNYTVYQSLSLKAIIIDSVRSTFADSMKLNES